MPAVDTHILSIDPGDVESGWVVLNQDNKPVTFGLDDNDDLLAALPILAAEYQPKVIAIEMIAAYGMSVGQTIFETCVWIGRFQQRFLALGFPVQRVVRMRPKMHHCHRADANDANIKAALVDRFFPGASNHGKGPKDHPTWFYDFKKDIWQAYALGVYAVDVLLPLVDDPEAAPHIHMAEDVEVPVNPEPVRRRNKFLHTEDDTDAFADVPRRQRLTAPTH